MDILPFLILASVALASRPKREEIKSLCLATHDGPFRSEYAKALKAMCQHYASINQNHFKDVVRKAIHPEIMVREDYPGQDFKNQASYKWNGGSYEKFEFLAHGRFRGDIFFEFHLTHDSRKLNFRCKWIGGRLTCDGGERSFDPNDY